MGKKILVKTGFRSVPIMFSQETSNDDKKQKSPEQHTERLGRKLSKLGQKYSEIDQSIEKDEKPMLKNDRIFGIRHGQNMKHIEIPGFDFQPPVFKFENGFQNLDDLKKDFENDFQNGFNAYKWDSFHDELMKPNYNATVTTVPIVLKCKKALDFISNQPKDKTNSEIFNEYQLRTEPISRTRIWKRILLKPQNKLLLTNPGSKVVLKTTVILKVSKSV